MRAAALIAQPDYGTDADRHDVFVELANRDFLRCAWRVGLADAVPLGELPGPALRNGSERGRQPSDVSTLHLRHDRRTN